MFDLDAYLERVRLPVRPTLDGYGLQALQRAHRLAIPFENLDVILGRAIAVDGAAVFAKLVTSRRGGFCFEHNRLFLDALAALGFTARPLLARVWLGVTEVPPRAHTLALVTLDDGDRIADAGFGGSYAPPLPLADGAEAIAPDGARFRLIRDARHGWMVLRDGDPATTDGRDTAPGWRPQYSFTEGPVWDADLAMGSHWAATAPASPMRRRPIVSIVLPHGFATLTGPDYRRWAAGTGTAGSITDPRVYRMRLGMMFGIDLSVEQVAELGLF
ncbi:arylamine N-acetyltransferase [uncultured Sphingomonas sp.]|uniref:arylamine N-acetyltransferase family protein n=1 Tax=uncultured Sphingomonas sp. TaxID=158754 RepID=UPI0035CB4145